MSFRAPYKSPVMRVMSNVDFQESDLSVKGREVSYTWPGHLI